MLSLSQRRRVRILRDFYGYNERRSLPWLKVPFRALRALYGWVK